MNVAGIPGVAASDRGVQVSGTCYDIDLDVKVRNVNTIGVSLATSNNLRGRAQVYLCGTDGVFLTDVTDSDLDLYVFGASRTTNNTSDCFVLAGACARNRLRLFGRYAAAGNQSRHGLLLGASSSANTINGDLTNSAVSSRVNGDLTATGTKISGTLRGYGTENTGANNIANGATSRTITHNLPFTPTAAEITVTPTNNLGDATQLWVSGITSTEFVVNSDADPGASTATFAWSVKKLT
jgi:hypothetical protein